MNKGETGFEKQLKLALTWNRIDIAKDEILTEDAEWQVGKLICYEVRNYKEYNLDVKNMKHFSLFIMGPWLTKLMLRPSA